MHLSVCLLIVFYCLRPLWKIDVLSLKWPLKTKSLLLLLLLHAFFTEIRFAHPLCRYVILE